eukprot:scaffold24020_cov156-Isochrysis_galbana.AAC.2
MAMRMVVVLSMNLRHMFGSTGHRSNPRGRGRQSRQHVTVFHSRPPSFFPTSSCSPCFEVSLRSLSPRRGVSPSCVGV